MRRLVLLAILASSLLQAQGPTGWQGWIDSGARAFSARNYTEAVNAFQRAGYLHADDVMTKLYLGAAHMNVWLKDRATNADSAFEAEEQFRRVLITQPENDTALLWLGSLLLQQKRLDEAEIIYGKAAKLVRNKSAVCDASYAIGVIAWSRWFTRYAEESPKLEPATLGVGPLEDSALKQDLRNRYGASMDEALTRLQTARGGGQCRANAAAYRSLLFRQLAAIAADRVEHTLNMRRAEDVEAEAGPGAAELRAKLETSPQLIPPPLPAMVFDYSERD